MAFYRVWVGDNDSDWAIHLGARNAGDVAALLGEHARRLRLGAHPDVVVVDENRKPVPVPTELKAALDALHRIAD